MALSITGCLARMDEEIKGAHTREEKHRFERRWVLPPLRIRRFYRRNPYMTPGLDIRRFNRAMVTIQILAAKARSRVSLRKSIGRLIDDAMREHETTN